MANQYLQSFWSIAAKEMLQQLGTTLQGLTSDEAKRRLAQFGANVLKPKKRSDALSLFLAQFRSPITLILIFAAILSLFLHDPTDAVIILAIILISGILGFWQERGATNAVKKLIDIVQTKTTVIRDGSERDIPLEEIVPGDVVALDAGDVIPGDSLVLESKELFVNEATLTGETFPVEKSSGVLPEETPISQRKNTLFMGTHVTSGSTKAIVVNTGIDTEFGKVSQRLRLRAPETEFERGVHRFGYLLMEITLLLVIAIFASNVYLKHPIMDSFLFSLALAVGLTPQLLPAIISVNLAHGARRMAQEKVIVKRLTSIENFGSMNVLCSDKTGTLTEGAVKLHSALDIQGNESQKVILYAYLNATFETGFTNPIDEAIRSHKQLDVSGYEKLDEVPYDFVRKRLSILVSKDNIQFMVTKGALQNILDVCSSAENPDGTIVDIDIAIENIQNIFQELSSQGFRILGLAYRDVGAEQIITREHESHMTFLGLLVFFDAPKPGIADTIKQLRELGVSLKMVTGDNRLVAANISKSIGLSTPQVVTGPELRQMSDDALLHKVNILNVFAEVEPNQKERIILAMRKSGNVVGYMGDGINDAPALHAADVGISVDSAVDVAKEAADIILLEKDLNVLSEGIQEGRKTFANTLKYVFMATSANFGNMFSMAGASLFLPFLPLLPKQVLLTNLLTDFPEMSIATDTVDADLVEKPRRWDMKFIRKFMVTFGILSSVFDYLTFFVLLYVMHATMEQFRTGWFLESVISASVIVLAIRTRKPVFRSKPGRYLLIATVAIVGITIILPLTPLAGLFGFHPLPFWFYPVIVSIVAFYVIMAEVTKRIFYRRADS